jgi:hypothetical protein
MGGPEGLTCDLASILDPTGFMLKLEGDLTIIYYYTNIT